MLRIDVIGDTINDLRAGINDVPANVSNIMEQFGCDAKSAQQYAYAGFKAHDSQLCHRLEVMIDSWRSETTMGGAYALVGNGLGPFENRHLLCKLMEAMIAEVPENFDPLNDLASAMEFVRLRYDMRVKITRFFVKAKIANDERVILRFNDKETAAQTICNAIALCAFYSTPDHLRVVDLE